MTEDANTGATAQRLIAAVRAGDLGAARRALEDPA